MYTRSKRKIVQTKETKKTKENTELKANIKKRKVSDADMLLNTSLMKKCLDLYAIINNYESKPCQKIPAAVRHHVWIRTCGRAFESTCSCCRLNTITVFNFHCAHIEAKSKGGSNHVSNLIAVCIDCNLSMGTESLYDFKSLFFDIKK